MFGIPKEVTAAIDIAQKAQAALKDLKTVDADHDGKADLQQICDLAKSMAPDMAALSIAMAKGAELLTKEAEPLFADVVAIGREVMPEIARLTETSQKIFALAALDMKAIGNKYKLDLEHLF
jgi:hypothetical protein